MPDRDGFEILADCGAFPLLFGTSGGCPPLGEDSAISAPASEKELALSRDLVSTVGRLEFIISDRPSTRQASESQAGKSAFL